MLIKTLVENKSFDSNIKAEHGLSLYLEVDNHKLLFDLGGSNLLVQNAEKMGVDLKTIDTVIISHGHVDHGGALKLFLSINNTAKIYIHKNAFEKHYFKFCGLKFNVGLDQSLKSNNRITFVDKLTEITPNIILFTDVQGRKLFSPANKNLVKRTNGRIVQDDFNHEQHLILRENNKVILVSGCCHNGLINTLDKLSELSYKPDYIISGMHVQKLNLQKYGSYINKIAKELNRQNAVIYTCHCTGFPAYKKMKETMGNKMKYLSCGTTLELRVTFGDTRR